MSEHRHGARVLVARFDDEHADERMLGRTGVVVGRIVDDHGATAKDPLLVVAFERDPRGRFGHHRDAFWQGELEGVPHV